MVIPITYNALPILFFGVGEPAIAPAAAFSELDVVPTDETTRICVQGIIVKTRSCFSRIAEAHIEGGFVCTSRVSGNFSVPF